MALPNLPLFENAIGFAQHNNGPAIDDIRIGKQFSYCELVHAVASLRSSLLDGRMDLNEERVAILCPSGFSYVVCQWAIWAAGGIAVPLCTSHPLPEQVYSMEEAQTSRLLGHVVFEERVNMLAEKTGQPLILLKDSDFYYEESRVPEIFNMDKNRRALIIFTSGTTGKPKAAVSTHDTIDAQTAVLVKAWRWTEKDRIHHILPLHHVHGVINALTCALYSGATVEMHQKFDPKQVWERWAESLSPKKPALTIFMSVPTIYSKLIGYYKTLGEQEQQSYSKACQQFRFMVSGSASLPTPLRESWERISGHILLERYGMTEIGMALSQGYDIDERIEGTVGFPMEGVQVRLMAETPEGSKIFKDVTDTRNVPGMIQIKGRNVFKEYWGRPEATKKEFTEDLWFITGDFGMRTGDKGYFKILGRGSIDIIKSGGEKVSALEIERELLSCPLYINDVAVIGIPDPEWGQRVAAVAVMEQDQTLDLKVMRDELKSRLAVYKVPSQLRIVSELPKNAMGKVMKKKLVKLFE
ncbi:putative peroxisomal AMP binding enzyme [Phycomyces blakesleeanus]|uniref:Peroxisomal AMP binding enzyme n=1 Tax=Phycomyces blakesleeanus TaxID=4837 RepID=A0ABR3AUJ4_PHYBL